MFFSGILYGLFVLDSGEVTALDTYVGFDSTATSLLSSDDVSATDRIVELIYSYVMNYRVEDYFSQTTVTPFTFHENTVLLRF